MQESTSTTRGTPKEARHRCDHVRRLFDRMDHVEAAGGHESGRLCHEGHVESELGHGWARLDPPDRQPEAPRWTRPGTSTSSPWGYVSSSTRWPAADEGTEQGEHREWRPPDLEEGLRSEEQDPEGAPRPVGMPVCQWLRKRSASMAAMQPLPAAVTAWRYRWSWTSPAAKTPGTLVAVVPSRVSM